MNIREIGHLTKAAFVDWQRDNVQRLSASVAFYTLLSLAPLLVLVVAIASSVFSRSRAQAELILRVREFVGPTGAAAVQDILQKAGQGHSGALAVTIGVIVLLIGASAVFSELQDAFNLVWDVKPRPGSPLALIIRQRLISFVMILATGVLLLASVIFSTALSAAQQVATRHLHTVPGFWRLVDFGVSLVAIAVLLTLVYKTVPDVHIPWGGAAVGAVFGALLFTVGKELLSLYLGRSSYSSAYGAAGSLVVLVIWVYYSAQIIFVGAEFAEVYVNERGRGALPMGHAMPRSHKSRARKGLQRARRELHHRLDEQRQEHERALEHEAEGQDKHDSAA